MIICKTTHANSLFENLNNLVDSDQNKLQLPRFLNDWYDAIINKL